MVEFSSQVGKLFIEQLNDMEMVKNDGSLGEVFLDSRNIGRRHIHGHRFYPGFGWFQTSPERQERIGTFAVADKYNGTGFQIQHDGQIFVAFADGNFIDGNQSQFAKLGASKSSAETFFLDFFYEIPTYI